MPLQERFEINSDHDHHGDVYDQGDGDDNNENNNNYIIIISDDE